MSQAEAAVKDVNFDEPATQRKKINYKEVFLQLQDGDNLIRFVDSNGKKIGTHWVKDTNGKQRSVKCPIAGCPCCLAKPEPVPTQWKNFYKVVDKLGTIRVFEFGPQIMKQLKTVIADIKEDNPNALLTQRDIIVNKGAKGTNPLYTVKLVKINPKPTPQEGLRQQAIEEAIKGDTIDLAEIVVPWTVKRINEYIYGIKDDGSEVAPANNGVVESSLTTKENTDFNFGKNVPAPAANKSDEDLSMFD